MDFRHIIFVDISDEYLNFALKRREIKFALYVNIQIANGKVIPIAIGQQREILGSTLVGILDFETIEKMGIEKADLLQLMLEYGIGKLLEKDWIPPRRPILVFRGHERLQSRLGEGYKAIMETATLQAGANEVRFE